MISYDLENFVGIDEWVLVNYVPFEDHRNLAWINIIESTEKTYIVHEVDSCYFEGHITSDDFRYIGGTSNKRHLICDEKIRSKDEMRIYKPCNPITLAEVFRE